jgi:hypothetical protein
VLFPVTQYDFTKKGIPSYCRATRSRRAGARELVKLRGKRGSTESQECWITTTCPRLRVLRRLLDGACRGKPKPRDHALKQRQWSGSLESRASRPVPAARQCRPPADSVARRTAEPGGGGGPTDGPSFSSGSGPRFRNGTQQNCVRRVPFAEDRLRRPVSTMTPNTSGDCVPQCAVPPDVMVMKR